MSRAEEEAAAFIATLDSHEMLDPSEATQAESAEFLECVISALQIRLDAIDLDEAAIEEGL